MTVHTCSICRRNPAPVRVHTDGTDVWWCGQCIADRINTTRGILKTSTGVSDARMPLASLAVAPRDDDGEIPGEGW